MTITAIPIVDIATKGRHLSEALYDIAVEMGFNADDEYTFTFRISIEGEAKRQAFTAKLKERDPQGWKEALAVLEQYEWDVSFLVDCF